MYQKLHGDDALTDATDVLPKYYVISGLLGFDQNTRALPVTSHTHKANYWQLVWMCYVRTCESDHCVCLPLAAVCAYNRDS
jgi:hypothetical protein